MYVQQVCGTAVGCYCFLGQLPDSSLASSDGIAVMFMVVKLSVLPGCLSSLFVFSLQPALLNNLQLSELVNNSNNSILPPEVESPLTQQVHLSGSTQRAPTAVLQAFPCPSSPRASAADAKPTQQYCCTFKQGVYVKATAV